jgi:hypothetical protein
MLSKAEGGADPPVRLSVFLNLLRAEATPAFASAVVIGSGGMHNGSEGEGGVKPTDPSLLIYSYSTRILVE